MSLIRSATFDYCDWFIGTLFDVISKKRRTWCASPNFMNFQRIFEVFIFQSVKTKMDAPTNTKRQNIFHTLEYNRPIRENTFRYHVYNEEDILIDVAWFLFSLQITVEVGNYCRIIVLNWKSLCSKYSHARFVHYEAKHYSY